MGNDGAGDGADPETGACVVSLRRWFQWRSGAELDEEIAGHLEAATRAGIERGLAPDEARYAARRRMGNVTRVKERARENDPLFWIEPILKDLHYALRSLRRNPGFTAAAVLSLALGIGVNCAIFSFADALLLRPLDVRNPGEIVQVSAASPRGPDGLSYREYAAYRDRTQTLAGLVAETSEFFAVQTNGGEQARIMFGNCVSGNYFSVFGVQTALGRSFLPEEDSAATKDVPALLSYASWQARFQSDPRVVGRRIKVDGEQVTIVGVLPERFLGTSYFLRTEIYLPLGARARVLARNQYRNDDDGGVGVAVYGRLKPGVSAKSAQAEFTVLAKQMQEKFPDLDRDRTVTVAPDIAARLQQDSDDTRLMFILLAIAAAVLLLACLNVANLLLGRASARVRELAIRQSVGAGRGRLIAQMLTESAVLAALGTCVGVLLAGFAIRYFAAIPISPDFSSSFPVRLDGRVLSYALAAAACSVVVSSLWPAIRASRIDLVTPAKGAAGSFRGRSVLVGAQTTLATMLLVSAALFVKSFILTSRANPGFRVDNVLIAEFDPSLGGLSDAQAQAFYRDVEERVSGIPGVRSAAWGSHLPMGTNSPFNPIAPEGTQEPTGVMFDRVEPAYFATMAVPILAGRGFDDSDRADSPGVAVVNQALAQQFWPRGAAIGQRIRFGQGPRARVLQVVGISGNGKYQVSVDRYQPYVYVLSRQFMNPEMTLFVYTAGDPAAMAPAVRAEVKAVAPDVPVHEMHTMREIFEQHGLLPARMMALMVGTMGVIGLTLGVVGLYAVIAFAVTRRTREIGIRMALGARAATVLRGVLASGLRMTLAGVAVGLAGAFALTRYLAEFLDRVQPHDAIAFAGVPVLLLAAALAACWAPARRAARVDPAETLRYQ